MVLSTTFEKTLQTVLNEKQKQALLWLLVLITGAIFIRHNLSHGHDTRTYWHAVHFFLMRGGEPMFNLERDGWMAFKYPPWIVPLFLPFGWIPFKWVAALWGLVQIGSLVAIYHWLRFKGFSRAVVLPVTIAFGGLWSVHALDGQVNHPFLAIALWGSEGVFSVLKGGRLVFWQALLSLWALTVKVVTFLPALSYLFLLKTKKGWILFFSMMGLFWVLSFPAFLSHQTWNPMELGRVWYETASSGGAQFAGEKTRGRDNQGLPALILRKAEVPAADKKTEFKVTVSVMILVILGWAYFARKLPPVDRFVGWVALVPVIHPLSWFHLFVGAYPLAVFAVGRAFETSSRHLKVLSLLGVALTAAITRKTLGDSLGWWLELWSIKSIGVLILATVLVCSKTALR